MRLITSGDPTKILESIGRANNLLSRKLSEFGISGETTGRIFTNGIDIRIDKNGINQVTINQPKKEISKEVLPEMKVQNSVVVYAYEGSKYGAISALLRKDIIQKTVRYWGTLPAMDLTEVLDYNTIVIIEPKRILTDTEARIFNKLLLAGKNIFIFPGTDTTVYNSILIQLGSNLRLVPMSVGDHLWSIITDNGTRYRIIGRRRGFLHPILNHTLTGEVLDPFGKMFTTKDVISMTPAFYVTNKNTGFTHYLGSELLDMINAHRYDEHPPFDFNWVRNTLITTDIYPYDWTILSLDETISWLTNLSQNIIRTVPDGYTAIKDEFGYLTYEERTSYDFLGSFAAHEKAKSLYAFGYSPYWMLSVYDPSIYDKQTDIQAFCRWMAKPGKAIEGMFSPFIPVYSHYYTYFDYIWGGAIQM